MKMPVGVIHATLNGRPVASSDDGEHIDVPGFAVAEAKSQGFTVVDPEQDTEIDIKADLVEQPDHHLANFLAAHGVEHHYFEKRKHIYSDLMRNVDELFTHGPTRTVGLTTQAGALDFSIENPHETLHEMKVTSGLVPAGTRIDKLDHTTGKGTFRLPNGVAVDAIIGGTDSNAQVVVSVLGSHIADALDDFHARFHEKGPGRTVFLTREEMLSIANDIVDKKVKP